MAKKQVKLAEIAERTGVSVTTASMVLSGKGRISEEVRLKVLHTARDMGYRKKSPIPGSYWAILLPMEEFWDNIWHFIKPAINNILQTAISQDAKYSLIPIYNDYTSDQIVTLLKKQGVTSVFSFHFGDDPLFRALEKENIQVIVINNSQFQDGYYSVCVDDFQGAYEGTKHLIDKNHSRIVYMDYPISALPSLKSDRYFGFRKALEEHEIPFSKSGTSPSILMIFRKSKPNYRR